MVIDFNAEFDRICNQEVYKYLVELPEFIKQKEKVSEKSM